jgi:hypothetical protein
VLPVAGCSSNFPAKGASASAASQPKAVASIADAVGDDPILKATAQALAKALGDVAAKAKEKKTASHHAKRPDAKKPAAEKHKHKAAHKPEAATTPASGVTTSPAAPAPTPAPAAAGAPAATPTPTPTPTPDQGSGDSLLDYLFGGGGDGG